MQQSIVDFPALTRPATAGSGSSGSLLPAAMATAVLVTANHYVLAGALLAGSAWALAGDRGRRLRSRCRRSLAAQGLVLSVA